MGQKKNKFAFFSFMMRENKMTKEKCFKCRNLFDKEDLEQIETVSSGTVNICADCTDEIIECDNCHKDDFKDKCHETDYDGNLCEECYEEYKNEVLVIDAGTKDPVDYREFTGSESGFWTEEEASIYGEQCPKCKVFYISGEHDCKGWNFVPVDLCPNCGELFVDPITVVDENGDEVEYRDDYMNTGVWTKDKVEGMPYCPKCNIWIKPGDAEIKKCCRCKSDNLKRYPSGVVQCLECDVWIRPGKAEIKKCPRCKSNKLEKYDSDDE